MSPRAILARLRGLLGGAWRSVRCKSIRSASVSQDPYQDPFGDVPHVCPIIHAGQHVTFPLENRREMRAENIGSEGAENFRPKWT